MEKRFQVFLSSTYEDLKEERLEVLKALLELDCIPCGMEYFPAASEDQWSYIKELIAACDYYVVIVGARYGSTDEHGVSYTQKEYEYAIECGIPTIAFVHGDPSARPLKYSEESEEGRKKLEQFLQQVRRRLCKEWRTAQELGAVVSRSITQLMKREPRTGWVRADAVTEGSSAEILRLTRRIQQLEHELNDLRAAPPEGAERLAQGDDLFSLQYTVKATDRTKKWNEPDRVSRIKAAINVTWNEMFAVIAPELFVEAKDSVIKSALARLIREKEQASLEPAYPQHDIANFTPLDSALAAVKMQFRALGLIEFLQREVEGKVVRLARLTPRGEKRIMEESVIQRDA